MPFSFSGRRRINRLWYQAGEWYPSQAEARAKAAILRKRTGMKVRIIKIMKDRRYPQYWLYTR